MFTGIIQSIATIVAIQDQEGLRTITLDFKKSFCADLKIGASISVDGVCLTVTKLHDNDRVEFDVMLQSLMTTTLGDPVIGSIVNIERAAKQGVEVGGHALSGHIDFCGTIIDVQTPPNNCVWRIQVPPAFMHYIFSKGYIAVNGASLTVSEINRIESWFEVWLIPETLRATTFDDKIKGDCLNIEIDRGTQVVVDTIRLAVNESLASFLPSFAKVLLENKIIDEVVATQLSLPSKQLLLQK